MAWDFFAHTRTLELLYHKMQAIPPPHLFHATLQTQHPILQVDVAVEQTQQLSCTKSGV